ncbi:MAG: GntR family transcriptional regulator [Alphaproteobacteria bacterium]
MRTVRSLHRPVPLREQVYAQLRDLLRQGRFAPRGRVSEVALADALGVSRTPVREALGQLSQEGFVVALRQGGFAVPEVTPEDIAQVFEIRRQLEPYAARRAAERATAEGLAAMAAAIATEEKRFNDVSEVGVVRFSEANAKFRSALFGMAGNPRLARSIATFEDYVQFVRWRTLGDLKVRGIVVAGQRDILDAVKARDTQAAEAAMHRQLDNALTSLLDRIESGKGVS